MITRQPSPPAANGRRFGTMSPRRTRYATRNQGVLRNRKSRFHTWTEIFSGLTERCDAAFLINSCPPFLTHLPGEETQSTELDIRSVCDCNVLCTTRRGSLVRR